MSVTQVVESSNKRLFLFPFSGAGSSVAAGALVMPGATNGTNEGVAIPVTASSNLHGVGVLAELHNFGLSGDALQTTLVPWFPGNGRAFRSSAFSQFPSRQVELFDNATIIRMDYSLVSTVAVASATATVLTITSEVAGFGGGFVYYNAGTGIGELKFLASSAAGIATLVSASGTTADSTTKLTKVLPYFYDTPIWLVNTATAPTLLDSVAGDGTGRAVVLGSFISKNGIEDVLDPKSYHGATGLNNITGFALYSLLGMVDTAFHPVA